MLKFTIVIIATLVFHKVNALNEDERDQMKFTILQAKNRAFDQVQGIKALATTENANFIADVNEVVLKSLSDMEALRKEFDTQSASCDVKDDINNNAVKTVAHFQSCTEKVINYADADMNSLAFDGSLLVKEIDYPDKRTEELSRQVEEYDARSYQFAKYLQRLEKCKTQSNMTRLKRHISEALASYKRCLQNK
ncbi:uncharacterized protein LOC109852021 isoform X2 [Pseudomyrmex gracilis]|uniref:uncharacterized protein LOC109852021 isoform X2 n=1 Tax=Pseudomyrmex gracilis TaxID=219809 RepID=UPI000994DC65|nr:uncharacterized protein LOC109852021 isoform X2 [Pseudomyrmex gracilis]